MDGFAIIATVVILISALIGFGLGRFSATAELNRQMSTACINKGEIVLKDVIFKCEVKR